MEYTWARAENGCRVVAPYDGEAIRGQLNVWSPNGGGEAAGFVLYVGYLSSQHPIDPKHGVRLFGPFAILW